MLCNNAKLFVAVKITQDAIVIITVKKITSILFIEKSV